MSQQQYYMSLTHRVESAHHKTLTIQVLISQATPYLTQETLQRASASAAHEAGKIMPGIEITSVALIARIELGFMTPEEFDDQAVDAAEPEANAEAPDSLQ